MSGWAVVRLTIIFATGELGGRLPTCGRTFGPGNFVILDEAQNTTVTQMKMFLTRIGTDCTVVINGDVQQSDLKGPMALQTRSTG